jgi:hypothetical protein
LLVRERELDVVEFDVWLNVVNNVDEEQRLVAESLPVCAMPLV